jgi:hypothetical protein
MGVAEIIAFLKALPELVGVIKNLQESINTLSLDIKNKNLEDFKSGVTKELDAIIMAKNDNDRKNGIVALSRRLAGK